MEPSTEGATPIRLRVAGQTLYRVDSDFPRLTTESLPELPDGIIAVRYSLDTSVCGPWEVASDPAQTGPLDALTG